MPNSPPRIMFYHDGRHPLIYMYEPPITRRQWEQCVDELLGTPVDCLVFNLGTGQSDVRRNQMETSWFHCTDDRGEIHLTQKNLVHRPPQTVHTRPAPTGGIGLGIHIDEQSPMP